MFKLFSQKLQFLDYFNVLYNLKENHFFIISILLSFTLNTASLSLIICTIIKTSKRRITIHYESKIIQLNKNIKN